MSARAMPSSDSERPRAASFNLATSFENCSSFRKAGTGTASLVSLSIIMAVPMLQLGWQPQESWPQSDPGLCSRSAQSEHVLKNEIGYQSRAGSSKPAWFFRYG